MSGGERWRDREALINEDVADAGEAADDEADEGVGVAGGADMEGAATGALELEPPPADEGAGVAARFEALEAAEDLDDQLVGKEGIDQIAALHSNWGFGNLGFGE